MVIYAMQNGEIRTGGWNKENQHHQTFKAAKARAMLKHSKILFKNDGSVITSELDDKPVYHFDMSQDSAIKRMNNGDYLFLRMQNINNHNADEKYVKFLIMRNNAEVQLNKKGITEEQKEMWNNRKAYDEKMMQEAKDVAKLPNSKIENWMTKSYKKPENPTQDDLKLVDMWDKRKDMPARYNLDLWIAQTHVLKTKNQLTPRLRQMKEEKENDTNTTNTNPQGMVTGASQFNGGMDSDSELSEEDDISGALNSAARNLYM
ncbi:hypothetical protein GUITHDRAFT_119030 [Guillardia theta CCMP2712]|uniref:Uncharacterized protein n=1 Tax=Guillardia theta (strain CCMP2712) TaxID=905079 RepID=L1IG97_GUITC|nr:hypothetical protein GUITHDRAFT_119030 [Guillardia theta CCMP2712]EKX34845.1 hypothetical protein GUITHDRAFT_119030 [Guillardia theta CCMP2712]|eukprot:XP_005821825.1 hypothetical protein GUITHDRAFT_119030 [Guillardia theta CCMP2712]